MKLPGFSKRELKEKRQEARKELFGFLNQFQRASRSFQTVNDCYQWVQRLQNILQNYQNVLPGDGYQRLYNACQLTDGPAQGVSKTCDILAFELKHVASALPSTGAAGAIVAGVIVVGAVAVGGAVGYAHATATQVIIKNDRCQPIPLILGSVPVLGQIAEFAGIDLPDQPIPPNGQGSMAFPATTVEMDGTEPGKLKLSILGRAVPISISGDVEQVLLDGEPLMGQRKTFTFAKQSQHELVVRCK